MRKPASNFAQGQTTFVRRSKDKKKGRTAWANDSRSNDCGGTKHKKKSNNRQLKPEQTDTRNRKTATTMVRPKRSSDRKSARKEQRAKGQGKERTKGDRLDRKGKDCPTKKVRQ